MNEYTQVFDIKTSTYKDIKGLPEEDKNGSTLYMIHVDLPFGLSYAPGRLIVRQGVEGVDIRAWMMEINQQWNISILSQLLKANLVKIKVDISVSSYGIWTPDKDNPYIKPGSIKWYKGNQQYNEDNVSFSSFMNKHFPLPLNITYRT